MKNTLVKNYWLIILGWCMFLNSYYLLGLLFSLAASFIVLINMRKIDYLKICGISLLIYGIIFVFIYNTSIPYFFKGSYIFLFGISLNASITLSKTNSYKLLSLLKINGIMFIAMIVLSLIISIVPSSIYSLFTKRNLFLMDAFIFLPYKLPLMICVVKKGIRNYRLNVISRKSVTA